MAYVFLGELFLTTPFLVIMIVLCTLSGPERRPDLAEIPIRPLPAPVQSRLGMTQPSSASGTRAYVIGCDAKSDIRVFSGITYTSPIRAFKTGC